MKRPAALLVCLACVCLWPAAAHARSGFHPGNPGSGFHPERDGLGAYLPDPGLFVPGAGRWEREGLRGDLLDVIGGHTGSKWRTSPDNWENSENNWDNSPKRWENNPKNWENNPNNPNSKRIVYDQNGNAIGYVVPKKNGGANYFDLQGNRKAYLPPP